MKPTIGRIVHYVDGQCILPAIVVCVWSDICVNLQIFTNEYNGPNVKIETSRTLDESENPQQGTWHWPPRN